MPATSDSLAKNHTSLCQRYIPRALHDSADCADACRAIGALVGFEEQLNADQVDYLEAISSL